MDARPARGSRRSTRALRWLARGLRALLVLAAVVGILFGWKLNEVRHQRSVVDRVAEFDAKIRYDYEYRGAPRPPGPKWLRRMLGNDFFSDVAGIEIVADRVSGDAVAAVSTLPHLKTLLLNADGVDDRGLAQLARARELEQLEFRSTTVTDVGLAQLAVLKELTSLVIAAPGITDVGLIPLEDLPNLTKVDLISTDVTTAGADRLRAALPNCHIQVFPEPPGAL